MVLGAGFSVGCLLLCIVGLLLGLRVCVFLVCCLSLGWVC